MTDAVLTRTANGVTTITLNRPDVLNAIDDALLAGLRDALLDAKTDDAVRAVVLTGAGRGFCAGADLSADAMRTGRTDTAQSLRDRYHPIVLAMRQLPKPIVAAVNGPAAGAGMSLALACDVVLAAETATFLQAFTRIGLIPDCGSTWFLPRLVGEARARAMILLADRITAREALDCGLVWRLVPEEALAAEAGAIAARLAAMPTRALALAKQALVASAGQGLADQLETEAALQSQAFATEDFREGVDAFLTKRPPRFAGR